MKTRVLTITLLLVFCVACNFGHPYENEVCKLSTNEDGVCETVPKCAGAEESIKNGVYPSRCGFDGAEAIICCQKQNRLPGEISRKKCKEYSEYAWETIDPVVLLIQAIPIKIYECPFEAIPLVIGGQKAGYKEFPHMALIGYPKNNQITWDCGGTIISENYILTAAHCLLMPRSQIKPQYVALGFTDKTNASAQVVKVLETIRPQSYNSSYYNDIGLLKVETIKFDTFTRPACLNTNRNLVATKAIATGWGRTGAYTPSSNVLMKVNLEIFSNDKCNKEFEEARTVLTSGIVDDTQICAGSSTEIKDTCKGDSGGPLQTYHQESEDGVKCMYDILGVTSFGKVCGKNVGSPGVYTRVSSYIKWIEDIVWPEK